MNINTLQAIDIANLYAELYDDKALFNGTEISVIYDSDYEVQSLKEKTIRVLTSSVPLLSNSDIFTINGTIYKVIAFQQMPNGMETIIGLER